MLLDYTIQKPAVMDAYKLHQMVAGLFNNDRDQPLFCDRGDNIVVRTTRELPGVNKNAVPVPIAIEGEVRVIELRASCFVSSGGKKIFLKPGDWKARHEWLRKKGARHGFEVLTVNCISKTIKIQKPGAPFVLDQTDFTATIKILDQPKFNNALKVGVGAKGRAFGFGLLIV